MSNSFTVGDKVRVLSDSEGNREFGEVGEVSTVFPDGAVNVRFKEADKYASYSQVFTVSEIEHVLPPPPPVEPKLTEIEHLKLQLLDASLENARLQMLASDAGKHFQAIENTRTAFIGELSELFGLVGAFRIEADGTLVKT